MAKIICVDFDGVIHSYTSGWKGVDVIPDEPVPGALEWLMKVCFNPEYEVHIYSSRSQDPEGLLAMKKWLDKHLEDSMRPRIAQVNLIERIQWPEKKPPAWLTLDDRCICFKGTFPSFQEMEFFKPWNKA